MSLGPVRPVEVEPEQGVDQEAPAAVPAQEEAHAPPPPVGRTMGQRVERVEHELRGLRDMVDGVRADVGVVRRDVGWIVESISQIMVNDGINHHLPDGRYIRGMATYGRRVRRRTDEASTSGTHSDDVTPDQPTA